MPLALILLMRVMCVMLMGNCNGINLDDVLLISNDITRNQRRSIYFKLPPPNNVNDSLMCMIPTYIAC